ncbi:hypothetical protein [Hymenobacter arcticus]
MVATGAAPVARPRPLKLTEQRPEHAHRYTGTVGSQAVTVELRWQRPDSVMGGFYYHRRPNVYGLTYQKPRVKAKALALAVTGSPSNYYEPAGTWQFTSGPPGAVLAGSWVRPGQPAQAFVLHESYAGAVRYTLQNLLLTGGPPEPDPIRGRVLTYERTFLTLTQPAAVPGKLQRVLASSPAIRRRQMLAGRESDADAHVWLEVTLNDFGLFSYQISYDALPFGGQHQNDAQSALFAVATGQPLTVASQLRPGYERPLRRLLSAHLLHDDNPQFDEVNKEHNNEWRWRNKYENPSQLVPLPDLEEDSADDLTLTAAGLEATYSPFSLYESPGGMMPFYTVLIPYRELRPLVRPGTPLARMLWARGL